jgi:WD40 repeat protein
VFSVTYSPDGKWLAATGLGRKVCIWDAGTGTELRSLDGLRAGGASVVFAPDGKYLAIASGKTVEIWNVPTEVSIKDPNGITRSFRGHTDTVNAISFSPDGKRLATASSDSTVRVWDAATGLELLTLKGHTGKVTGVAFSPDGTKLATCGADKKIIIYDGTPKEK